MNLELDIQDGEPHLPVTCQVTLDKSLSFSGPQLLRH